jgi:hypothetical protein
VAQKPDPDAMKIGIPAYVGEIADSIAVIGAAWTILTEFTKWLNDEVNPPYQRRIL